MRIDADTAAAETALTELYQLVRAAGGAFRPDATVVVRDGAIRVTAEGAPEGGGDAGRLLQVPTACLPALAPDGLGVDGESFVLAGERPNEPDTARTALDAMRTLYNACGKAAAWRVTSPWLTLARDPALLAALADLRAGNPKTDGYRALAERGAWDRLLVDSFLGTRLFRLPPASADGQGDPASGEPVLMPFIDFLNHDFRARPYGVTADADGVRRLWSQDDRPTPDGRECRVLYTVLDPLDSLLFYGFVDETAPVMRSAPVEIALPEDVRITVNAGASSAFRGELPATLEDVRLFVPPAQACEGAHLTLPWLLLPGPGSPWALRRVLRALIYALCPEMTETARRAAVASAEEQVLQGNRAALDRAGDALAAARTASPADPPAGRSAALDAVAHALARQRARLDAYCERLGLSLL